MKAIHKLIMMLSMLGGILTSCELEEKIVLPKFKGITADENTIFLLDRKSNESHKIYAVDTLHDKIVYRYDFTTNLIYSMVYDEKSKNIFLDLNMRFYKLEILTGKLTKINLPFNIDDYILIDSENEIWLTPTPSFGYKNFFVYNTLTGVMRKVPFPEGFNVYGFLGTPWELSYKINEKIYAPVFSGGYGPIEGKLVYNLTENKLVSTGLTKENISLFFLGDNFIHSMKYDIEPDVDKVDLYRITSFEPFEFDWKIENYLDEEADRNYPIGLRAFSNDESAFFVDKISSNRIAVTKFNTTTKTKEKSLTVQQETPLHGIFQKNDHIWIVSSKHKGAYKIDKDLKCTIVK